MFPSRNHYSSNFIRTISGKETIMASPKEVMFDYLKGD